MSGPESGRSPDEMVEAFAESQTSAPDKAKIQEALTAVEVLRSEQLGRLASLHALRNEVDIEIAKSVGASRELGVTWTGIGAQLGVSGQAAQQRFDR